MKCFYLIVFFFVAVQADQDDNSHECKLCWEDVNSLNSLIGSPFVKNHLMTVATNACKKLDEPLKTQCDSALTSTFASLITDVQGFIDSTCIAGKLNCAPATEYDLDASTYPNGPHSDKICQLMEPIYENVPYTYMYWQRICERLPSATGSQVCANAFENQSEKVVEGLQFALHTVVKRATGKTCEVVKAARTKRFAEDEFYFKPLCDLLQNIIVKMPEYWKDLTNVCKMFPGSTATTCETFLTKYASGLQSYVVTIVHALEEAADC